MSVLVLVCGCGKAETVQPKIDSRFLKGGWPVFRGSPELHGVSGEVLKPPLREAWRFKADEFVTATAAIGNGRVFIGSQGGFFYCLNLETGKEIWKRQLSSEFKKPKNEGDPPELRRTSIESSACLLDDSVYVGVDDGNLYCLNTGDGSIRWKFETDGEILGGINFHRGKERTVVVFGSYDNFAYGVDAKTGEKIWEYETGNYINGTPTIAEGRVFFGGCDGVLYQIDVLTGEEKGKLPIDTYIANSAAVDDGVAYIAHYGNQIQAFALDGEEPKWTFHERDFPYFASPTLTRDRVIVGGRGKRVYTVDRETGEKVWQFKAQRSLDSSAVVSGDVVYIGSDDGRLYGLSLEKGAKLWEFDSGDAIKSSPAIAGGRLVISSEEGIVYAFEPEK